jgi:biotin-(acetyl-CoA carboxylase) ligase
MLGSPEFFAEWQTNLAFKNQMVHIEQEGQPNLDGILLGIDGHGNLRVESNDGKEVSVMVGDVHLRPAGK